MKAHRPLGPVTHSQAFSPVSVFAGQAVVMGAGLALAASMALPSVFWALSAFLVATVLSGAGLVSRYPHNVLGLCNTTTLLRAALVAFLFGALFFTTEVSGWLVFAVGAFAFALPFDQQGEANWIGQKAGMDTVLMQAPNKAGDLISSNFYDALVLGVPENDVFRISSALSGKGEISGNLHGASTLSTAGAASLRHQGQSLIDRAISDFSDDRAALKRLSDQFIKLFLWELVKSNGGGLKEHRVSRPARLVGDATDLVLSDVTGNIGLTTLCAHYGVSLRTLHYAFKDVTGLSAATWLRRMRLNRVHRELQGAISNGATIGSVAATYGFHHQGHFTNQYKRLFGCLPSETLHRN